MSDNQDQQGRGATKQQPQKDHDDGRGGNLAENPDRAREAGRKGGQGRGDNR